MRAVAGMLEVRGYRARSGQRSVSHAATQNPGKTLRIHAVHISDPHESISPNREERWKYIFSESLKAPMAFFFERKL